MGAFGDKKQFQVKESSYCNIFSMQVIVQHFLYKYDMQIRYTISVDSA